jgi:thiol-disulfide isomerase/thioredoxin
VAALQTAAGALLAALAVGAAAQAPASSAGPEPGTRIDWPPLVRLDGAPFDAPAASGKGAIVVFWATHCPFCKRHNAHLDKLWRALGAEPVAVLGAALDDDAATVARYMAANGYGFPVVLGAERFRARFTPRRVIPTTCVLDRGGRLRQCIPGEMFEEDVLELVALARQWPR